MFLKSHFLLVMLFEGFANILIFLVGELLVLLIYDVDEVRFLLEFKLEAVDLGL